VACVLVLAVLATAGQPLALTGIRAYQRSLAPLVGRLGLRCRFTPSCSHYAEVVIARDGLMSGGLKSIRRIARCGPWTPAGSVDPP
jgi:putative membrane protein insertion efficiency factor